MTMTPYLRKFALTVHVASAVGSLGAVAAFLALALAGLWSADAQLVRAAYLAAHLIARYVILPLLLASLLTGLVQSLGTPWGLFRHYWILVKLLLNVFALIVLLLQIGPISHVASIAADNVLSSTDLRSLRGSFVTHAAGGLLVLLTAATLAVYKPRGMTPYGARKQSQQVESTPRWVKAFAITAIVFALAVLLVVLTGIGGPHGPGRHMASQ